MGVGQDEIEIASLAHTVVVVAVPGMGDDVQAIKAGVLEIADVHVVSKCDRDDASRTLMDLKQMLTLGALTQPKTDWKIPVIGVSAYDGTGLAELLDAITRHWQLAQTSELGWQRRRRIADFRLQKTAETVRLCKVNLAVHALAGDIREGNTYYEDLHDSVGKFHFVMANPPFNVDRIDKDRLAKDPRFPFGLPKTDNGNYIWIQIFYSALTDTGRAGFVMANSASDARGSELEIRRKLIETGAVDVMVAGGKRRKPRASASAAP